MPAHPVPRTEEAGAEHVVGAAAGDGLEHALEVARVVLPVPVEVDGGGIALVAGDFESASESGSEAARGGVRVDARAEVPGDMRRGVARAVVDEEHVDRQAARLGGNGTEDRAHGRLLISGHDNGKRPA